jgi:hypothetical protein
MLIKWNGDGLLGLPQVAVGVKEGSTDLFSNDMGRVVILLPGWNEITDEEWELAAPHIKDKMEGENPKIEIYAKKEADKETGSVRYVGQAIGDVRSDKARDIVTNCFNVKCLKKWDDNMKITTEVAHLIDKQLEYCLSGEGPKKK